MSDDGSEADRRSGGARTGAPGLLLQLTKRADGDGATVHVVQVHDDVVVPFALRVRELDLWILDDSHGLRIGRLAVNEKLVTGSG